MAGFFFLAVKYGGRTCGWWLVANIPTTGSPSVFCSQKKELWSMEQNLPKTAKICQNLPKDETLKFCQKSRF
jgi:hypothetical protein